MKVRFKTLTFIVFICAAGSLSASMNMKTADKDSKRKVETERKPLKTGTQPMPGAAVLAAERYQFVNGSRLQPMHHTAPVAQQNRVAPLKNNMKALYAVSFAKVQQKAKETATAAGNSTVSAAALPAAAAEPVAAAPAPAAALKKTVTKRSCMVCMDDKKDERFIKLSCGHDLTCFRCLKAMLLNVFKDKTTAQFKCPEVKCKKELGLADVKALTATVAKWNAFDSIVLKESLAKNPLIKHCPTPKCTIMYKLTDLDPKMRETVNCKKCNKSYCSHCQFPHSKKTSCAEAKENRALTSDTGKAEKATDELIKKTSKPCPKCKVSIAKDEGCNQMHCTKCNYYFCWACGEYNTIKQPHHVCASDTKAAMEDQMNAKELFEVALSQVSHFNVSKQQSVRKFITQAQNIKSYSDAIELFRTAIQHGKVAHNIIDSVNRQFQEHFSQGILLMENVARCVVMILTEMQTRNY